MAKLSSKARREAAALEELRQDGDGITEAVAPVPIHARHPIGNSTGHAPGRDKRRRFATEPKIETEARARIPISEKHPHGDQVEPLRESKSIRTGAEERPPLVSRSIRTGDEGERPKLESKSIRPPRPPVVERERGPGVPIAERHPHNVLEEPGPKGPRRPIAQAQPHWRPPRA